MTSSAIAAIRPPEVAGRFYPDGQNACADLLERCLSAARASGGVDAKVVVAPHAGWGFSGAIAGTAYAALRPRAAGISRVVLLGPAHRVAFRGIATTSADAWATPLGDVAVDWTALTAVLSTPGVAVMDAAFAEEHSLEVHAPFIRRVSPNAAIVPLLVGDASRSLVSEVVDRLWGGPETVIVVSSDLSHFHDHDTARRLDADTAGLVETLAADRLDGRQACGHRALAGVLDQARRRDCRATALDLRTSADTRGNPERVVGYGAFALEYALGARLPDADRLRVLEAARFGVRFGLEHGRPPRVELGAGLSPTLTARRASFVTLSLDGRLRGCIGSVIAHRALLVDVVDNAWKAAFGDRRFAPLTAEEAGRLEVSVSILSTPVPLDVADEADLLARLRPDVDGLILQDGDRRGIFLPSVWSGLPKAESFVTHLKRKAGLPADHWSGTLRVSRYTTESFGAAFREVA